MKKNALAAGLVLTVIVMAACGSRNVPADTVTSETETTVSSEVKEAASAEEKSESSASVDSSGESTKAPVKKQEDKEELKKSYSKYGSDGELIYKIDYDEFGHPTYEYDNESGNSLEYTYELKDENGNDVLYKYDAGGNLIIKWEYYGRTLKVHVETGYYNGTMTYETVFSESGDTLSHKTLDGAGTDNEYDADGNLIKSAEAGIGYDIFSYNEEGQLAEQKGYDENGALLYTITNEYDENGNITKGSEEYADGSESMKASYKYDKNGFLLEIVTDYGDGYLEKDLYVRDEAGRELEYRYVASENGKETEIQKVTKEYDSYGNVVSEIYYSMGKKGGETKYVYTYDNSGNILKKESYINGELLNVEDFSY